MEKDKMILQEQLNAEHYYLMALYECRLINYNCPVTGSILTASIQLCDRLQEAIKNISGN